MDLTRNGNPVLGNSLTKKVGLPGKVSERWKKTCPLSTLPLVSGVGTGSAAEGRMQFSARRITSGQASKPAANNAPASVGLASAATLAAAGRGVTTAITYEERAGPSICDRADLMRRSASAISTLGATAARTKHTLDGLCVNTIVLMRPIRFDNHAATGNENAASTPLQKKKNPALASDSSNL